MLNKSRANAPQRHKINYINIYATYNFHCNSIYNIVIKDINLHLNMFFSIEDLLYYV
jgi:hypothetical protein